MQKINLLEHFDFGGCHLHYLSQKIGWEKLILLMNSLSQNAI